MAHSGFDKAFPAAAVALVLLGLLWTLWLWPTPISDYELYWNEAGGAAAYERGGVGVLLFALARSVFPQPQWAALAVNLPAALILLRLLRRCDPTRSRVFAWLGTGYLLLITPYFGIVQVDLVATALLGCCWALLLLPLVRWRRGSAALAVLAGAAAVSTRPQFALTLSALAGLLALAIVLLERGSARKLRAMALPAALAVIVAAGFASDLWGRHVAGTEERVRTSSAVTLYSGLLVADDGLWCGSWTPEATQAAYDDREMPLLDAVAARLSIHPAGHWLDILQCKFTRHLVLPIAFALYWVSEPLREEAGAAPNPDQQRRLAAVVSLHPWETRFYRALTLAIYAAAVVVAVRGWRSRPAMAVLPLAWLLSFWLVHLVFEVQGRYFLATIALLPLLCALVQGGSEAPEAGTAVAGS